MRWYSELQSFVLAMPAVIRRELFTVASLTKRISRVGNFSVRVLRQGRGSSFLDEALLLGSPKPANIRNVVLYCDSIPVAFARTVLPLAFIKRDFLQLTKLGNKSLGAILHSDMLIESSPPMVAQLGLDCDLLQEVYQPLPGVSCDLQTLWARRVVYNNSYARILVNEVFLPDYWYKVASSCIL